MVLLLSQAGISCFLISMAKGSLGFNCAGANEEEERRTSTLQKPEQAFGEVRTQEQGWLFTALSWISHFPVTVSLFAFSVHLVCSGQEFILQRCPLLPVLCNTPLNALAFYCVGTLSALNMSSQLKKGSVNPISHLTLSPPMASVLLFRPELCERESSWMVVPRKGSSASFWRGHKSFMLNHCIHRWQRPEHNPKRDQRGNGDPVTHVHGLIRLMIFC